MDGAIVVRAHGGPEVLEWTQSDPGRPGPGEVLIRHSAVGLNFIDVYHRALDHGWTVMARSLPRLDSLAGRPQVTTDPSPLMAAKAPFVPSTCTTSREISGPSRSPAIPKPLRQ